MISEEVSGTGCFSLAKTLGAEVNLLSGSSNTKPFFVSAADTSSKEDLVLDPVDASGDSLVK